MTTCPNCAATTHSIKSVISRGAILTGCSGCINTVIQGTELAAQNHRASDRRNFAQDFVQPFEKDFAKIYGEEKAREYGWDDESLRKWG